MSVRVKTPGVMETLEDSPMFPPGTAVSIWDGLHKVVTADGEERLVTRSVTINQGRGETLVYIGKK